MGNWDKPAFEPGTTLHAPLLSLHAIAAYEKAAVAVPVLKLWSDGQLVMVGD
jgi:hypothetical protein